MRNQLILAINWLDVLEILWCLLWCIYIGRAGGSKIDKENRMPAGKPVFVSIPYKWRWLFRNEVNTYAGKTKILRISFVIHLLGYLVAFVEMLLLISYLFYRKVGLVILSIRLLVLYGILVVAISCVSSYIYERNLQRAYDCDWITYYQECFSLYSKRKCRVIDKKNDGVYEIMIGIFRKHKYLATANFQVSLGERIYAIHVYNEDGPCWELRKH